MTIDKVGEATPVEFEPVISPPYWDGRKMIPACRVPGIRAVTTLGDLAAGFPDLFPVEADEGVFLDVLGHEQERVEIFSGWAYYRTPRCHDSDCWWPVDVVIGRVSEFGNGFGTLTRPA